MIEEKWIIAHLCAQRSQVTMSHSRKADQSIVYFRFSILQLNVQDLQRKLSREALFVCLHNTSGLFDDVKEAGFGEDEKVVIGCFLGTFFLSVEMCKKLVLVFRILRWRSFASI